MVNEHPPRIMRLDREGPDRLAAWREEWLRHGLATGPVDRARVERAIGALYTELGRPVPRFVWVASPAAMITTAVANTVGADPRPPAEEALQDSLGARLGAVAWEATRSAMDHTLRSRLDDHLGEAVWAALWRPMERTVEDQVWRPLRDVLSSQLSGAVVDSLAPLLAHHPDAPLRAERLRARARLLLAASGRYSLSFDAGSGAAPIGAGGIWTLRWAFGGQHDVPWVAFYRFCQDVLGVRYPLDAQRRLALWAELCHGGWWAPYENHCLCAERPVALETEPVAPPDGGPPLRRLHAAARPAIAFGDGFALHVEHGVLRAAVPALAPPASEGVLEGALECALECALEGALDGALEGATADADVREESLSSHEAVDFGVRLTLQTVDHLVGEGQPAEAIELLRCKTRQLARLAAGTRDPGAPEVSEAMALRARSGLGALATELAGLLGADRHDAEALNLSVQALRALQPFAGLEDPEGRHRLSRAWLVHAMVLERSGGDRAHVLRSFGEAERLADERGWRDHVRQVRAQVHGAHP